MVTGGGTTLNGVGGEEFHTLTTPEMPNHTHPIPTYSTGGGGSAVVQGGWAYNNFSNAPTTLPTGNGSPHNNVQPTIVVNYIIYAGV
jgi:microcystin-dependent protein